MIKSIYSLLAGLLLLSSITLAQSALDKGNYQLAGSATFSYSKAETDYFDDESTSIQIAPQCAYFVDDNLLIGGLVSFSYDEYKWTEPETGLSISRHFGIGPLIKYYFRTENFVPFVGMSATYNKYFGEDRYGYSLEFNTGLDFFIAKSFALEPFCSYKIRKFFETKTSQSTLALGLRLNYFIVD